VLLIVGNGRLVQRSADGFDVLRLAFDVELRVLGVRAVAALLAPQVSRDVVQSLRNGETVIA